MYGDDERDEADAYRRIDILGTPEQRTAALASLKRTTVTFHEV